MLPSLEAARVTLSWQASPQACWAAGGDGGACGAAVPGAPASKLQALFDLAQSTFAQDEHPTRRQVEQLQRALGEWGGAGGATACARRLRSRTCDGAGLTACLGLHLSPAVQLTSL